MQDYSTEIISIGTELLLGEILDTNAQYLSEQLTNIGIGNHFRTTVGDNKTRIQEAVSHALKRADIVITTGGLGPTDDDITVSSIAEIFGEPLTLHQPSLENIKRKFQNLQKNMPISNEKQAYFPASAQIIENPSGTAPGILWERVLQERKKYILTFPGVPSEMYRMFQETAKPFLVQLVPHSQTIVSRSIKTFGIQEAKLAELVDTFLDQENPTVAPLAENFEARLRVTAKSKTYEEAYQLINKTIQQIEEILPSTVIYGYDDDQLETVVGQILKERGQSVAIAESCTGGLISSRLTDVSGSSEYTRCNIITYSNQSKTDLLSVPQDYLEKYGAVSPEVAGAMAEGVRVFANTDYGLAITGIAGPTGGSHEKPVGLAYMAIADSTGTISTKVLIHSSLTRSKIKWAFSQHALNLLRLRILHND